MGDYPDGSVPVGLARATDVDSVARAALSELLALPDVRRAGVALVEGGGRRLRFLSALESQESTGWCHIDAYDDVPLTSVVRTGIVVLGDLSSFGGRYGALVETERDAGTHALAVLPLAGVTIPIGGLIAYFDREQRFDAEQRGVLDALAQRVADAVRRMRRRGVVASAAATQIVAASSAQRRACALEDDPRAVGVARRFLRETLPRWGIEDGPVDTAELCLSELVTNAVIHAGATSELTLTLDDDLLTVAVRDHGGSAGPDAVLVEDDDPLRVFGRGLVLVDALSDSWGSVRDAVGTTSWFVLDLSGAARPAAS